MSARKLVFLIHRRTRCHMQTIVSKGGWSATFKERFRSVLNGKTVQTFGKAIKIRNQVLRGIVSSRPVFICSILLCSIFPIFRRHSFRRRDVVTKGETPAFNLCGAPLLELENTEQLPRHKLPSYRSLLGKRLCFYFFSALPQDFSLVIL